MRLKIGDGKRHDFPYWKLRPKNHGELSRGVVLELPENGFIELFSMGKPRDQLRIESFEAAKTRTVIAINVENKMIFKAQNADVEWIGQLKPSHAQRIVRDVGNSFSGVGVIEAEWLRIKAERERKTVNE